MNQLPVYVSLSNGTDSYWRNGSLIYTDGVKAMCEEFKAYWTIDVVRSYLPQLTEYEFLIIYYDVFDNHTSYNFV